MHSLQEENSSFLRHVDRMKGLCVHINLVLWLNVAKSGLSCDKVSATYSPETCRNRQESVSVHVFTCSQFNESSVVTLLLTN